MNTEKFVSWFLHMALLSFAGTWCWMVAGLFLLAGVLGSIMLGGGMSLGVIGLALVGLPIGAWIELRH